MSRWASLEARFVGPHVGEWLVSEGLPRGSESGPRIYPREGWFDVAGRLRDVSDLDAPAALAWFVGVCDRGNADTADFVWSLDGGPRYRYQWRDGGLVKERGVLDL